MTLQRLVPAVILTARSGEESGFGEMDWPNSANDTGDYAFEVRRDCTISIAVIGAVLVSNGDGIPPRFYAIFGNCG